MAREQARARQEMQLSPGEVGRGAELMQRVTSTPPTPHPQEAASGQLSSWQLAHTASQGFVLCPCHRWGQGGRGLSHPPQLTAPSGSAGPNCTVHQGLDLSRLQLPGQSQAPTPAPVQVPQPLWLGPASRLLTGRCHHECSFTRALPGRATGSCLEAAQAAHAPGSAAVCAASSSCFPAVEKTGLFCLSLGPSPGFGRAPPAPATTRRT